VKVRSVTYLILLMNSLNLEINVPSVLRFYERIAGPPEPADRETVASLVLLWENAISQPAQPHQALPESPVISGPDPVLPPLVAPVPSLLQSDRAEQREKDFQVEKNQLKTDVPPETPTAAADTAGAGQGAARQCDLTTDLTGRYLYGIGWGSYPRLEVKGLDDAPVHGIEYQEVVAVVHACQPRPYESAEPGTAEAWVLRHQQVLDQLAPSFRYIIPMGFDVIVDGTQAADPDQVVRDWLAVRYERIMEQMQRLSGNMEYGVRFLIDAERLAAMAPERNPRVGELERKLVGMSKGTAYLFRNELNNTLRETMEEIQAEIGADLKQLLIPLVAELKEDNSVTKPQTGQEILVANLAILAEDSLVEAVGAALEEIQTRYGARVEFTGPWPPYSFVEELD
jgi:hypothetical protein